MGDDHTSARPLRADARRNRERVLRIAQEALAADGLTISFDEIARRAGFGVGTVYRHFPTKEALFEAVLLGRIERFVADARAKATAEDAGEAFFGWFAGVVEQASANQALCDMLDSGSGMGFRPASTLEADFVQALGRLLARAQRAGAVRRDLGPQDVHDLLRGCLTAERRARARGAGGRMAKVVCDGMRPR
ncbi:TetR/AcrR family transcriptional regulator [Nonomuraea jiangxiensis]|uniref:DNA-binding transcriptional regulator, AcrR family n=1 Tax=Nonomuraea jiangxiensis TaxID=633440 RepID=A0A1G9DMD9_9ACTN|nr:TetR/AcrR family transcriptional regulator [Nonomuraea jiangxiensis]SDK65056.1 DNA-binding transcriptional regulator, AcrR family [Nonomuraea jiangxiensis]